MEDMRFSPSEWRRVGRELQRRGDSITEGAGVQLSRISRPIEGADQGATIADLAVSVLCPVVGDVIAEMVQTMGSTLSGIGQGAVAIGDEYERTEDEAVALAQTITQDL